MQDQAKHVYKATLLPRPLVKMMAKVCLKEMVLVSVILTLSSRRTYSVLAVARSSAEKEAG